MSRTASAMLAALALGAGCTSTPADTAADAGAPSSSTAEPAEPARPFEFETITQAFVDTSRPHTDGMGNELAPERTLETVIRIPVGGGPRPVILFSHGLGGHPSGFTELLDAWAAAGYLVAAPTFPLSNGESPDYYENSFLGVRDQPADISFVLDQLIGLSEDEASPLAGRVDETRVGAGGLSLGGGTTLALGYNDCCRDERLDALEILSGFPFDVSGEYHYDAGPPTLVVHGDADASLPYATAQATYDQMGSDKWLVTLIGGSHSPPYEDADSPWDDVVIAVTIDFWDAELLPPDGKRPDHDALAKLEADATADAQLTSFAAG